ncbi:hypothetical protein [Xanthomonas arboricola]|uniref:hypothetical protein n=1 Tax=Xanthomonas arboricola TaxID=56448 RepID=UPI0011AFD3C9|nr:hypothetical protein [Xanthomonas arboricola]
MKTVLYFCAIISVIFAGLHLFFFREGLERSNEIFVASPLKEEHKVGESNAGISVLPSPAGLIDKGSSIVPNSKITSPVDVKVVLAGALSRDGQLNLLKAGYLLDDLKFQPALNAVSNSANGSYNAIRVRSEIYAAINDFSGRHGGSRLVQLECNEALCMGEFNSRNKGDYKAMVHEVFEVDGAFSSFVDKSIKIEGGESYRFLVTIGGGGKGVAGR